MYAFCPVIDTYERNAACVTADYGYVSDSRASIVNANTLVSSHGGAINAIKGYVESTNPSAPGALGVHLDAPAPPITLPYDVTALGPIVDGQYQWAIITDSFSASLFVLARNVNEFKASYDSTVLDTLKAQGFTNFVNKPFATYHGDDCNYLPLPSLSFDEVALAATSLSTSGVDTVTELDVTKYIGRWYQVAASRTVQDTIETNAACVTADYALDPTQPGRVSVLNAQTQASNHQSDFKTITGYAEVPDSSKPGQLSVHLAGVPVASPYYVTALGPVVNNQYSYAIVTDNFRLGLFVLVRDVNQYNNGLSTEIASILKNQGFTNALNKPFATPQDNCKYISSAVSLGETSILTVQTTSDLAVHEEESSFSSTAILALVSGVALVAGFVGIAVNRIIKRRSEPLLSANSAYTPIDV